MEEKVQRPEKMSYEQLENIAHQLSEQNKELVKRLQQADLTSMYRRLDYLFAVLNKASLFPKDFVDNCVQELVTAITIPEEPKDKENV